LKKEKEKDNLISKMSDYYAEELDDAQWEASYEVDRLRFLREEEEDNASLGEQDHDACFPNPPVWTVWVNRVNKHGFLIHFYEMKEAYDYALSIVKSTKSQMETFCNYESLVVHDTVKSNKLLYIAKCESLQTAVFRGAEPTADLKLLSNNLYKIRPSHALVLGAIYDPEMTIKGSGLIVKVPISKYDLSDWKTYI